MRSAALLLAVVMAHSTPRLTVAFVQPPLPSRVGVELVGISRQTNFGSTKTKTASTRSLERRRAVLSSGATVDGGEGKGDKGFIFPVFLTAAVFNRILYRVQLVPMKDFTYFISQFSCCCYVLVYSAILLRRIKTGRVTQPMLTYARENVPTFCAIGCMEATTFLIALYSAARLPGGLLGALGQGNLVFGVILSRIFLGTRFDALQKLGVVVVSIGALLCTYPQAVASGALSSAASVALWRNAGLYMAAMGLTAGAVILKQKALQEGNLDVIIVSAFGSISQFVATVLLLPATFSFATTLPPLEYLSRGGGAFMGACCGGSPAMPWLAVLYMTANITLNLTAIALVKRGGAVGTMVASTLLVPVYGLVFCLNIPLLAPTPFSWGFVNGLVVVTVGSILYNHAKLAPLLSRPPKAADPPGGKVEG